MREEAKPGSHENAELQFGQQIAAPNEISASRRAARKYRMTHFLRCKNESFCDSGRESRSVVWGAGGESRSVVWGAGGKVGM